MATILVADDNSNIQKMVTLALKEQGINVIAVGNGEAAVRKLPDTLPDLVLADIFMPVRNGYEVCEFVKHDPRFAHIPVVLLVGAFDPLDEHEAQRVGADGVLKKPFVPPEPLITMVKSLLAKAAGQRPVPVAAAITPPVERTAGAPAADAAEQAAPPFSIPSGEPPAEGFWSAPARLEFSKSEAPLAFGELLEMPAVEAEPKVETTTPRDTGLGETTLWENPVVAEKPSAESEEISATVEPEAVPEESHLTFPGFATELSLPAEKAEAVPAETMSSPVPAESATGTEPEVAGAGAPAAPGPGGWDLATEQAARPAATTWPAATAPPSSPARGDAVQSFAIPQPPDPQLVEAVVARVIERLKPQILEVVTREILKPVVEALVRRELEKL